MAEATPPASFEVDIDELDDAARGTGSIVGSPELEARVPGALPGERVRAELVHTNKRGVRFGALAEVVRPSKSRVNVACERFLDCGGCDFLHADLATQHAFKRQTVASALGLELDSVSAVVASPEPLGYRALAKLVRRPDGVLGSYRPRTHDVVDMSGCKVHDPVVEAVVDAARAFIAEKPVDFRYLIVRGSVAAAQTVVTIVVQRRDAEWVGQLARTLGRRDDVARVVLNINRSKGNALLAPDGDEVVVPGPAPVEQIGPIRQSLEAGAFAQVNPRAAAALYALVVEQIAPRGRRVADLYSGSGGIALSLAHAGATEVIGVETHPGAVEAATQSASEQGLAASFIASSVEDALAQISDCDAVVLNPPRKGASPDVLLALAQMAVELQSGLRVAYVSCNPTTLARDLKILREMVVVEELSVTPVDLIPQTRHIETVLAATLRPLPGM